MYSNVYILSCSHLLFCVYLGNFSLLLLLLYLGFITITITLRNIFAYFFHSHWRQRLGITGILSNMRFGLSQWRCWRFKSFGILRCVAGQFLTSQMKAQHFDTSGINLINDGEQRTSSLESWTRKYSKTVPFDLLIP